MARLQKVIAEAGIASRRKAEEMIAAGRVQVNDEIVDYMGYQVKKGDVVSVDGKVIEKENKVYYVMNKPKKTICSSDDEHDRATVIDLVSGDERIFTVGRLDYDTSGCIILTNDGEFANEVIHPRYQLPKLYNLTIDGILDGDDFRKLKEGVVLDDGYKTQGAKVKLTEKDRKKNQCSLDLTIYEGKNRQVKRMMEALGFNVTRLHRKQIAFLGCSDLRQGEYRILKPFEIKRLRSLSSVGEDIR